jgi:two-component system, chemotaxis family, chemotaxis protein CheY
MRALIIDDSRAMRSIIGKILRELRAEVFEAGHGQEGLERLAVMGSADLVLVDWNMPVMDGLTFVRAVRARREYDQVKLVMVTTESDLARVSAALEAGASEYVMKPFDSAALLSKLESIGISVPAGA